MSDAPDDEEDDGVAAPAEDVEDEGAAGATDGDDDPFADLEDVEVEDDPFGELGDAAAADQFEAVDVEEVDDASVWAALGDQMDGVTDVAVGGDVPEVAVEAGEQIVPKRSYCEKCEHFSAPPETACTNPGTEIRELVDMKHFRVANCPVVARRRGLDDGGPPDGGPDDD